MGYHPIPTGGPGPAYTWHQSTYKHDISPVCVAMKYRVNTEELAIEQVNGAACTQQRTRHEYDSG
jgi:hypothetical protein